MTATKVTEYKITGLHCQNCSDDFIATYQDIFRDNQVEVGHDNDHLYIDNNADWDTLNRIASFEKIMFEPVETKSSHNYQEEAHVHRGHSHDHSHDLEDQSVKKMNFVFAINLFFAIFELVFGTLFNSTAILADAIHDLGDAVSIGLASLLQRISKKEANQQFSFGYERFSLLGGFITAIVLVGGAVFAVVNAVPRLFNPEPINHTGVFWVAIFAIVANTVSAWIMRDGKSINESMLSLHLLEDILGWLGVLVVSIVLQFTDWYILDPMLSIVIAIYILIHAWPNLKQSLLVFLEGVPSDLDAVAIQASIKSVKEVQAISHFHLWSMDGRNHALSVTISIPNLSYKEIEELKLMIREAVFPLGIKHVTIETIVDEEKILN